MGNINDKNDLDEDKKIGDMQANMLREMGHNDVYKKYKTIAVLVSYNGE